ncbi:hypothetical protein H7992_14495 [Sporosarcina sp. resist]|uniref:hypothetical protein n=1 Tax=Sporosarcina sp. resist TaxID=2762563 RepID=UPI00164DB6F2|nr:hypothetical protein [Sporosarcina sp. resist]QNK86469.1 hypothetical protein H7992_14495 [Sporosarcina sp. resist]
MKRSWQWEIRSMKEEDPYIIHTEKDDALLAVQRFVELWGQMSIYSIRKSAGVTHYEEAI